EAQDPRAIDEPRPRELALVRGEESCDVAIGNLIRREPGHAQLVERARESARQARPIADRRETPETVATQSMHDAGAGGFERQRPHRRELVLPQAVSGERPG